MANHIDRIVRESEARTISGLSRTTRWRLEKTGQFPNKVEVAPGLYGYRLSDLMRWLETRNKWKASGRSAA